MASTSCWNGKKHTQESTYNNKSILIRFNDAPFRIANYDNYEDDSDSEKGLCSFNDLIHSLPGCHIQ